MRLFFLFIVLLCSLPLWAAPYESPDAKTLELLNQGRSKPLKPEQVLCARPSDFPEATVVGYLSGSNQALVGSIIVAGKVYTPAEGTGFVLRAHGWEAASEVERKRLALLWLTQGQLAFGEKLVFEKPETFVARDAKYHEPQFAQMMSGTSRVITWIEESSADPGSRFYRRSLYWFAKDGRLLRARVLERYQVAI